MGYGRATEEEPSENVSAEDTVELFGGLVEDVYTCGELKARPTE